MDSGTTERPSRLASPASRRWRPVNHSNRNLASTSSLSREREAPMRKGLCFLALAVSLCSVTAASADWHPRTIDPLGYAWATCSAPYGCVQPLYTRRLVRPYVSRMIIHRRLRVRNRPLRAVRRYARRVVGRRHMHRHSYAGYESRGAFQYIVNPQLAAASAWSDVVNAEATER